MALGLALSGCGGSYYDESDPTESGPDTKADQLLRQARGYVQRVDAVRVTFDGKANGAPAHFEFQFVGSDMAGKARLQGGRVEIRVLDEVLYSKYDDAFLQETFGDKAPDVIRYLDGRWFLSKGSDGLLPVEEWGNKDKLLTKLLTPSDGGLYVDGTTNVDDVACFRLKGSDESELFVSTGDGRPILLTQTSGRTTFSYEDAKLPGPPPADRVVDIKEFLPEGSA